MNLILKDKKDTKIQLKYTGRICEPVLFPPPSVLTNMGLSFSPTSAAHKSSASFKLTSFPHILTYHAKTVTSIKSHSVVMN